MSNLMTAVVDDLKKRGRMLFILSGSPKLSKTRMVGLLAQFFKKEPFTRVKVHTTNENRRTSDGFIVVSDAEFQELKEEGSFIEYTKKLPEEGGYSYGVSIQEISKAALTGHPFVLVSPVAALTLKYESPELNTIYLKAKGDEADNLSLEKFGHVVNMPIREGYAVEMVAERMLAVANLLPRVH